MFRAARLTENADEDDVEVSDANALAADLDAIDVTSKQMESAENSVDGFFLLFLALSSNFLGDVMPCYWQRAVATRRWLRYLVLFALVYFTTAYSKVGETPLDTLWWSAGIFGVLFLATRAHIGFVLAALVLIMGVFVMHRVRSHYVAKTKVADYDGTDLDAIRSLVDGVYYFDITAMCLIGVLVVTGFVVYYLRQRRDHADDFSTSVFLFGPVVKSSGWKNDVCSTSQKFTNVVVDDDSPATTASPLANIGPSPPSTSTPPLSDSSVPPAIPTATRSNTFIADDMDHLSIPRE
jgi:hypothetical protein